METGTSSQTTKPGMATNTPEQQPRLGPEHKLLETFAGKWQIEGQNLEGAEEAAGTRVSAQGTYEMLPGGFFLIFKEESRFGDQEHVTMMIMGYDASAQHYPVHFFDNAGYTRTYQASLRKNTWTFNGAFERATYVFGDDGNNYTCSWERSFDGSNWVPLCELRATKVG